MKLIEFNHYIEEIDKSNPLVNHYKTPTGEDFYVEPLFYTHLKGFIDRVPEKLSLIMGEIDRVININKKVIFTGNFENPQVEKEGYVYQEIEDITNPLKIFVEDKSRGSDYGD